MFASFPHDPETLQWRHNGHNGVSNHRRIDCLLNRLFRRRSKKTSKLRVTGLCEGNSPVIGEFPAQRVSNTENNFIWWRHHENQCSIHTWCIAGKSSHVRLYLHSFITNSNKAINTNIKSQSCYRFRSQRSHWSRTNFQRKYNREWVRFVPSCTL